MFCCGLSARPLAVSAMSSCVLLGKVVTGEKLEATDRRNLACSTGDVLVRLLPRSRSAIYLQQSHVHGFGQRR